MPGKPTLEAVPAVKRKNAPKDDEDDSGDDSDSDVSMINVDFDFYNLDADVDQIAVKRLLRQTLSHDDQLIDVHPLAELILSESARTQVGSSIKTDGTESDPWGLVTALDVARNRDHPGFKPLLDYLLSTVPSHNPIQMVLGSTSSPAFNSSPALIFSMRMLNLPLPLIPPLYKMMMDELEAAERRIEKGKGKEGEAILPRFTHYLLWGRGYRLEGGEEGMGLDMHDTGKKSKKKNKGGAAGTAAASVPMAAGSFAYHPEEEFIDQFASHVHTFPLKSAPPRDDESFGVEQFGRLVLIEREKLRKAVEAMEEACR